MPIEIRELVIKATVNQDGATGSQAGSASPASGETPNETLINTCVEKVLQILKEKNER
ncbi:MAG: DUF5908 family protein [Ferruginibacter sp.]